MWNGTNSLVFLFRDFFEITFLSKDIPREHFGIYCIGFLIWIRRKAERRWDFHRLSACGFDRLFFHLTSKKRSSGTDEFHIRFTGSCGGIFFQEHNSAADIPRGQNWGSG